MKVFIKKLSSRKFIAALTGVITGVCLIAGGSTVEGASTLVASILGYLIAEGIVDASAVRKAVSEDGDSK